MLNSPLIQAEKLHALLGDKNIIIVDASSGKRNQDHPQFIQGSIFVDLDQHMAEIPEDPTQGGRHPLPDLQAFSKTLGELGITPSHTVIIYDEQSGANAAARFWWMLTAVGHPEVYVLDGGLQVEKKHGLPLATAPISLPSTAPYPLAQWNLPLATLKDVEQAVSYSSGKTAQTGLVIDVRDAARYRGEVEPIDLVAGHIPGAINVPFKENLNPETGEFLSPEALHQKYSEVFHSHTASEVIVHCGSGVTACHTLLAIAHAGLAIPKLYVGSWSEWSRVH
jgi:thiosulfate/3-mercaptopyruvate sulfurtransferase